MGSGKTNMWLELVKEMSGSTGGIEKSSSKFQEKGEHNHPSTGGKDGDLISSDADIGYESIKNEKEELLTKLESETFLNRYIANWKHTTGEDLSIEDAKIRIANQVDYTAAGPDKAIVYPYVGYGNTGTTYSPYSNKNSPIARRGAAASFETRYRRGPNDNALVPAANEYPWSIGLQYDDRGNIFTGNWYGNDNSVKGLKRHEMAHSYNGDSGILWGPSKIDFKSNYGHFDSQGSLKDVYTDIFGSNFKNYSNHAVMPGEISSAKAETEGYLLDEGLWDYNKEIFGSSHLDKMLNKRGFDVSGNTERMDHLRDMGFGSLQQKTHKLKRFNESAYQLDRVKDEGSYTSPYMQEDLFYDEWLKNNSKHAFNKHKGYGEGAYYQTAKSIVENSKRKKGKKYNKALEFIEGIDKIRAKADEENINNYRLNLERKISNERPEVERKMGIYFNELVQNEEMGDDLPPVMDAKYGAELPKAQRGKSIDDQGYRKWLKDWMNARKKTGRFEDQLSDEDLAEYKKNINTVQQITRDQQEQMFPGTVDNSGGLSYLSSPAGGYTLDLDELGNDNPKQHHYFAEPTYLQMFTNMFDGLDSEGSTKVHELTHAMTRSEGSGPFRKMYPNKNWKDYKDLPIQQAIKNIPIGFDEWYDDPTIFDSYEGDPEEILAQLMQYRYNFNVDPNRIFTEDDIKEVMKNVKKQGPAGLFGLDIFTPKNVIRLLNEVASVEDNLSEGTIKLTKAMNGKEIKSNSLYERDNYTSSAKKYRRGGEHLTKYQVKGEVKLTDIEKKKKHRSTTGEFYGGTLASYEIQDLWCFDCETPGFREGFDPAVNPEVNKWRSNKGFKATDLLSWHYMTQFNVPYNVQEGNHGFSNINLKDRSTWEGKNYGYVSGLGPGYPGMIGDSQENNFWFPNNHQDGTQLENYNANKNQAHAMSRDLKNIWGSGNSAPFFFFEGQPFINEEGDETDIRLGLKPGKQMQELEKNLKLAQSKSDVNRIISEFIPDRQSISYINNLQNPLNLKQDVLFKINEAFSTTDSEGGDGTYLSAANPLSKEYLMNENNYNSEALKSINLLSEEQQKKFWDKESIRYHSRNNPELKAKVNTILNDAGVLDGLIMKGDEYNKVKQYTNSIVSGNLNNYFDNYVFSLLDPNIATWKNKAEMTDFFKTTEFRQGNFDPTQMSYVNPDGTVTEAKDITIPYETQYDQFVPWGLDKHPDEGSFKMLNIEGEHLNLNGIEEDVEVRPKTSIRSKEEAFQSNLFPLIEGPYGKNALGLATGDFGFGIDFREVPKYNPYKKEFEWYSYDLLGNVTEVHTETNPEYNSEVSKRWRGMKNEINTNLHGNDFKNFLAFNMGATSTESINDGLAMKLNPYYNGIAGSFHNKEVLQTLQPHQITNEDDMNARMIGLSGKNQNSAMEWNGAAWVAAAASTPFAIGSAAGSGAYWSAAGNTIGAYWRQPGAYGWLGSLGNTLNYGVGMGTGLYNSSVIGGMTGWTAPGTLGLGSLNNAILAKWTYDSFDSGIDNLQNENYGSAAFDFGFGGLMAGGINNKLKQAYNLSRFQKGKFPDLTGVTNIGGTRINPDVAGPLSTGIRTQLPAWSLRSTFNSGTGTNIFKPQITQGTATNHFKNMLEAEKLKWNAANGFKNVVPEYNLLPKGYKLGDLQNKMNIIPK